MAFQRTTIVSTGVRRVVAEANRQHLSPQERTGLLQMDLACATTSAQKLHELEDLVADLLRTPTHP